MANYLGKIPNTHIRDFQRKRIYEAEDICSFWNHLEILSIDNVKQLVTDISKYFSIPPPQLVTEGHNDTTPQYVLSSIPTAYATSTELVLPYPITKSLPYICHEMSHVVNYNSEYADHHGRNFAGTYLITVKEFLGVAEFNELLTAFKTKKVKWGVDR